MRVSGFKGQLRRLFLNYVRTSYVDHQLQKRKGDCKQCGKCCEILFRCPFLIKVEDGASMCSIYEKRPGSCAAFPISEKCLSEVDFDCSYTFGKPSPGIKIEPAPLLNQAD